MVYYIKIHYICYITIYTVYIYINKSVLRKNPVRKIGPNSKLFSNFILQEITNQYTHKPTISKDTVRTFRMITPSYCTIFNNQPLNHFL